MLVEETCIELGLELNEAADEKERGHMLKAATVASDKKLTHAEKMKKLENLHGQADRGNLKHAKAAIGGHIFKLKKTSPKEHDAKQEK